MNITKNKSDHFFRKIMRRTFIRFLILTACFFFPSQVRAEPIDKQILDNGLTVLVREMPASPVVCVYALVKTGSATEGDYLGSGVSHFLEHMLFKGTSKRGVGAIAAQIQAVGGEINASTGQDYTIYTIQVPPQSFDIALDILTDMLMNSIIAPEEVEKERQVVLGEMRMRDDDPCRELDEIVFANIYIQHPYRHPIIGYKDLFIALTRDDVWNYYRSHYVPNNMIVSVAGNVRSVEIFPKIKAAFESFARHRGIARNLASEPPQISARRYEKEYPTDLTRLTMAFSGVGLLERDLYALDVLAMILGQGDISPLYRHVYKDKGLVHAISASDFTPVDRGFFEIAAVLEQKNVEPTIAAVWEEIRTIQEKGIDKKDLEKAKRQVLSGYLFGHQRASHVAYAQATDEAFTGDHQFSQKYVASIRNVTAGDIRRAARQYLIEPALTVVILKPLEEKSSAKSAPQAQTGEIQKYVLDNGLTVLLREDHTLPIVSIRLSLQGGTRQEPPELNGLSMMTANVWIKGTKARGAGRIATEVESRGMGLDTFSGKNSFGMNIECLSEDLGQAMGLMEDMIKNPVFAPQEIAKIRDNMKAAIRARQDDIFQTTTLALKETLFLTHPLRLDEEGSVETLERIRREDIVDFYGRLAVAPNMVLSVFGDISSEKILETIRQGFASLPKGEISLKQAREEPLEKPRAKEIVMDKAQAMVMFGFHGVDLKSPDRYGLEVLTAILGSSFSGRLFNGIREELGQAYTLGGGSVPSLDAGLIYFYVLTSQEKSAQVQQILRREIHNIQTDLVPEAELENTKTYLKGVFRSGLETNSALSFVSGLDELYGLGYRRYQDYEAAIDRVSAQDIQKLARQYYDLNEVAVVTTQPKKNSK